ncbi:MAG: hypothetical protein IJ083_15900 [Clostridia bacterium]|nr:hypothetical protein [Clostridia bacterium]
MAYMLYQTNKKTGVVYAFQAESYRDPVTKKPKSRRTYLGRVNPETHEIIPKSQDPGSRNRTKIVQNEAVDPMPADLTSQIARQADEIQRLTRENAILKEKIHQIEQLLSQMKEAVSLQ